MYEKHHAGCSRSRAFLLSLALVLWTGVGGTAAYLTAQTKEAVNTFTPSVVSSSVEETFDGTAKTDVTIQNTGDTQAYIRAAILMSWKDSQGNVYGQPPAPGDYTLRYGSGWTQSGGFWYCLTPIEPGDFTPVLIQHCTLTGTAPQGYTLSVEILAEAIQSQPSAAVEQAWGFVPGAASG